MSHFQGHRDSELTPLGIGRVGNKPAAMPLILITSSSLFQLYGISFLWVLVDFEVLLSIKILIFSIINQLLCPRACTYEHFSVYLKIQLHWVVLTIIFRAGSKN